MYRDANHAQEWQRRLRSGSAMLLMEGFRIWNDKKDKDGKILLLIPANLRMTIPIGFEVESISGEKINADVGAKAGEEGYVDDDTRGGLLAYGIRVNK